MSSDSKQSAGYRAAVEHIADRLVAAYEPPMRRTQAIFIARQALDALADHRDGCSALDGRPCNCHVRDELARAWLS